MLDDPEQHYVCHAVTKMTWDRTKVGDSLRGGTVIEGLEDEPDDGVSRWLLVVRYPYYVGT